MSHPLDVEIGRRLKSARILKGLSQTELADELGISFQQIQKYEKGANRVGSGRLWQIARFLGVPINYFFDDLETVAKAPRQKSRQGEISTQSLRAARALDEIDDEEVREGIFNLVKAASKTSKS
jgi:transcriptional regulator with XRE-family HTH domain